jgi:IPT/TIG domain
MTFYSPVVGGVQIGHTHITPHPDGSVTTGVATGTLGAIVRRRHGGQPMGLTCCHVVRSNEFSPREIMHQPAIGARLGQAHDDQIGGTVDCALVDLESRPPRFDVAQVGTVAGSERVRLLWQPVKKRGYRTELTHGRLLRFSSGPHSLNTRDHGWHETQVLRDQIEVVADPPHEPFVKSGDSGSALVTVAVPELGIKENMVIGLLCASDTATVPSPLSPPVTNHFALANQIHEVMRVLDVDVAVRPTITALNPSSALASIGTFGTVEIGGFGFDDSPRVVFGDTQAVVITTGAERIEVVPPLHFPGVVDVRVSNRFGDQSEPNEASKFTYEQLF